MCNVCFTVYDQCYSSQQVGMTSEEGSSRWPGEGCTRTGKARDSQGRGCDDVHSSRPAAAPVPRSLGSRNARRARRPGAPRPPASGGERGCEGRPCARESAPRDRAARPSAREHATRARARGGGREDPPRARLPRPARRASCWQASGTSSRAPLDSSFTPSSS